MFYVYALHSLKNGDLYIGYSSDLKKRFYEHNNGEVKSTQGYRPWRLIYYEAYLNQHDATVREKNLKEHRPKEDLKTRIKNSLTI